MKGFALAAILDVVEAKSPPPAAPKPEGRVVRAFPVGVTYKNPFRTQGLADPHRRETEQLRAYGRELFTRFAAQHPEHFEGVEGALAYLEGFGSGKVREGRRWTVKADKIGDGVLMIDYRSDVPLPDMCRGLIEGCFAHFGEEAMVRVMPVVGANPPRYFIEVRSEG
ncbi:heme NO-binding domain-containing protein [Parvularcula maris]|uniref:Heme NO-binding domain-containing protein n=1 Tax=Parvularcula maris TaxID=2965077 RepID=A0A9X2L981_9PROT|nr:heme NO-binding domain-containing protein [Parvularcula maris]MCQ8185450.1 heme NO-binding domain-containing protein [Parvularcula maris]